MWMFCFSSRRRHTRCALVTGVQTCALPILNQGSNPVVCATTRRASVSGVNAHLLELPREPRDFRVVVTFHHEDGSLCEAELAPAEAARLMSEILGVINQGNGRCSATAKPTRGSIS